MLILEGGPKTVLISFLFVSKIINFSCFFSRFLTPCFFTTLSKEQLVIIKNVNKYDIYFMKKEYLYIYNNLINLTTNKKLYSNLDNKDIFSDRLSLFLLHFAFFLKNFKSVEQKHILQEIYDFNFRQIELSIREIGYGDQSINKKMKDYINLFHTIIGDIHFWNKLSFDEKKKIITKFLDNFKNIKDLVVYFDEFNDNLAKKTLNSYLKSVSNP